ncbi:MAG: serine/threonine protein kinase [Anaerolineales bacterium]|nr:serine/threonine protein kinase [Anaerolineales bacterium]
MSEENVVLNGRYELIERIGSGGMSVVYKARDRALGRIVAVKMMHESFTNDKGFLKRFQQEAHSAANLAHPNIVTVHDIGQDEYKHYIVMEFVEGQTLKQIIRSYNDEPMPISRALDLIIQVCNGIGYAHRANLVHCDVKPQNVIVTVDERVKVADFGIARAISTATQVQQVSQVWGTPQYFSPEQAAGDAPTPASDVYAIGIILFEMLTGQLPFAAESHTAMALKHLHTPPPLVTEFNPAIPSQLAQIINKLLAKEPAGRYRTAGQLGRILSTYRQRSQEETGPIQSPFSATTQQAPAIPVAEQKTEVFQRPDPEDSKAITRSPMRPLPKPIDPITVSLPRPANGEMDWTAVSLGIFALVALIGLIPLWYLVFRAWVG